MTKATVQIHPEEGRVSRTFKHGKVNQKIGSPQQDGYLQTIIDGKATLIHRLIYEFVHGPIPKNLVIDHINRDKQDNRIENLRLVTPSNNSHNQGVRKDSSTGVKGVRFEKFAKKFRGEICINRVRRKTKYFATIEEASAALDDLRKKLIDEGHQIV